MSAAVAGGDCRKALTWETGLGLDWPAGLDTATKLREAAVWTDAMKLGCRGSGGSPERRPAKEWKVEEESSKFEGKCALAYMVGDQIMQRGKHWILCGRDEMQGEPHV